MDDDRALQYPSNNQAGDVGGFGDPVTNDWARCDIAGYFIENGTSRNRFSRM